MKRPRGARAAGSLAAVLCLLLGGYAYGADPQACAAGKLKPDYLDKICAIGDILLQVSATYTGEKTVKAEDIKVDPLTDPAGIKITMPKVTIGQDFDFNPIKLHLIVKSEK